jgi:hypothetical protein
MRRKCVAFTIAVALAFAAWACSGGSSSTGSTSPSNIATNTTPVLPQGTWSVTIQTLSDSGPSFCIHQPAIGSTFRANYALGWSDDTVMFVPPDPIDWNSFTAKVSGDLNFTGANPPTGSGMGMCAHYVQASNITGSFSPDRKSFTATVTWSFTLDVPIWALAS